MDAGAGEGVPAPSIGCPKSTGPGTAHQSVNADETWTAAASPHTLKYDTTIYATVTIEACAEVLIAAGRICNQTYPGGVSTGCPAPAAVPCPK